MRKQYTEPVVSADTTGWGEDRTVERHPSYAQIEVTRTSSSGDVALYGSHTGHRNYICLKISQSEVARNLSTDWRHSKALPLIEVALSEAQFASMITGIGIGGGTPCTILEMQGKSVDGIKPIDTKRRLFKREMMKSITKGVNDHNALIEEIKGLKLSEKAKQAMITRVDRMKHQAESAVDFIADQFDEFVEKTVDSAKRDIDAHQMMVVQRAGLQAIANDSPPSAALLQE